MNRSVFFPVRKGASVSVFSQGLVDSGRSMNVDKEWGDSCKEGHVLCVKVVK